MWSASRGSFRANCWCLLLFYFLIFASLVGLSARKKNSHYKSTAADDPVAPVVAPAENKRVTKASAQKSVVHDKLPSIPEHGEFSIEDVDEERIDEILHDATKNLLIFFYDGRIRCPSCSDALSEIEEIDDDIEATGYIEVVKTDDRRAARECGVSTFPALVYYRRKNPILYDGEFKNSEMVWRWLRAHDEVATWDLTDDNFEYRTDSHSPDEGSLDWFAMFYDSEEPDCNAFVAAWETVAHKLRGLVHVGKVDVSVSDDVSERFRVDDNQCPTFLLFHRGKMYRYNDPAKDIRGLVNFALHKYKDQRGHRVPEPPTILEHFYEHVKERITNALDDHQTLTVISVAGTIIIVTMALIYKAFRIRNQQQAAEKKST